MAQFLKNCLWGLEPIIMEYLSMPAYLGEQCFVKYQIGEVGTPDWIERMMVAIAYPKQT